MKVVRRLERIIAVVLTCCMLLPISSVGGIHAYAATKTVRTYSALKTALTSGSKTVKLAADIKGAKPITVKSGTVTLDLNGHKITGSSIEDSIIKVGAGATLNIKSSRKNGGITNTKDQDAIGCVGGKLNIYAGNFKGLSYAMFINGGTVTVEGGTFRGNSVGISLRKGTLNLNGGTVTATDDMANALSQDGGTCNISKGTLKTTGDFSDSFSVFGGIAKMNGGIIKADGKNSSGVCLYNGANFTMTKGKVSGYYYGINASGDTKPVIMNIKGGEVSVSGKQGHAIRMRGRLKVKINGGVFQSPANNYDILVEYGSIGTWEIASSLREKYAVEIEGGEDQSSGNEVATEFKRNNTKYEKDMYIDNPDNGYSAIMDAFEHLEKEITFTCDEAFYKACYYNNFADGIASTYNEFNEEQAADGTVTYSVKVKVEKYDLVFEILTFYDGVVKKEKTSKAAQKYITKIDNIIAKKITKNMTKRQKIKAIHDYMVKTYSYDNSFKDSSYHFYGPLTNNKAVCQGYSELFFLFMCRLNIPCGTVTGFGNGGTGTYELHMWNYVILDGTKYFIDVTWDDSLGSTKYYMKKKKDFYKDGLHIPF